MLLNGDKPLVKAEGEKPGVIALREISAGLVDESILKQPLGLSDRDSEYPRFLTDPEPDTGFFLDGEGSVAKVPELSGSVEKAGSGNLAPAAPSEALGASPKPSKSQES